MIDFITPAANSRKPEVERRRHARPEARYEPNRTALWPVSDWELGLDFEFMACEDQITSILEPSDN